MLEAKAHLNRSAGLWLRPELVDSWRRTWLILFTFTGFFFSSSVVYGLRRIFHVPAHLSAGNAQFLEVIALQSVMLAALFALLRNRGWKLADVRFRCTWLTTLLGALLGIGLFLLYVVITAQLAQHGLLRADSPGDAAAPVVPPDRWVVLLRAVVNAFFEEITMTAYAYCQFAARLGPAAALLLIVAVRASFHFWKDPAILAGTALHFALLTLIYWKTRSLWLLILSHAIFDLA